MNSVNIDSIKNSFFDMLKNQSFSTSQHGHNHIVTPFSYSDGDMMEIFIDVNDFGITLTDDGITIERLYQYGVDINAQKKKISSLLDDYSATLRGAEITYVVGKNEDISHGIYQIICAMNATSYLVYNTRSKTENVFDQQVMYFLQDNSIEYEKYSFPGLGDNTYSFDIVVNRKNIVLPFGNKPQHDSRQRIEALGYRLMDMRSANTNFKSIAVLDNDIKLDLVLNNLVMNYIDYNVKWSDSADIINLVA